MTSRRGLLPFLACLGFVPASAAAQDAARNVSGRPAIAAQDCYDVRHYDLALTVDPAAKTIDGTLAMTAKLIAATRELALDLDPALQVHAVRLGGAPVDHEQRDGRIWVRPAAELAAGSEVVVAVDYGGAPHVAKNPPWDGGFTWRTTDDGQPWIATTCQGEGADLWWPCKDQPSDKPDSVDLHFTVPHGLVVASNGTLRGPAREHDGLVTWDWHVAEPISNYCVTLNAAPYVRLEDSFTCCDGTVMPIQFFVLPRSVEKAKRCLPQFLDHVHVFESILGPYPFRAEKYGICETPHLGMEHQTMIAYGNGFRDEQYDWLHNHELAHEWWGNLVTCSDWRDMWLHEGFGTYMQPLYLERAFGRDHCENELRKYRTMNRAPLAPRASTTSFGIYFGNGGSNDIYYKGALVLHTLRWQMGDGAFFASLRRFCYPTPAAERATDGSQVRLVTTDDYVRLCSELAGEDLAWFFEVYVRQPHLPRLHSEVANGILSLRWETPGDLPFPLDVPVRLRGQELRVPMVGGRGELAVGEGEYAIDPAGRILKERSKRKP